jgi:hypothetical protein
MNSRHFVFMPRIRLSKNAAVLPLAGFSDVKVRQPARAFDANGLHEQQAHGWMHIPGRSGAGYEMIIPWFLPVRSLQ